MPPVRRGRRTRPRPGRSSGTNAAVASVSRFNNAMFTSTIDPIEVEPDIQRGSRVRQGPHADPIDARFGQRPDRCQGHPARCFEQDPGPARSAAGRPRPASPGPRLSTRMMSGPIQSPIELSRVSTSTSMSSSLSGRLREPPRRPRRSGRPPSGEPGQVVIFDQDRVIEADPVVRARRRIARRISPGPASRGWSCGCRGSRLSSPRPPPRTLTVKVAIPLRRWRKFRAVRSIARSVRIGPWTTGDNACRVRGGRR